MKKKCMVLSLVLLMAMSMATTAFAGNFDSQLLETNDADKTLKAISEIPIYVTYLAMEEDSNDLPIKEAANLEIEEATAVKTEMAAFEGKSSQEPFSVHTTEYQITELDAGDREDMVSGGLYTQTFARAQELIDQGVTVNFINIYVHEPWQEGKAAAANDYNDPAYWEKNFPALGVINSDIVKLL